MQVCFVLHRLKAPKHFHKFVGTQKLDSPLTTKVYIYPHPILQQFALINGFRTYSSSFLFCFTLLFFSHPYNFILHVKLPLCFDAKQGKSNPFSWRNKFGFTFLNFASKQKTKWQQIDPVCLVVMNTVSERDGV